MVLTQGRRDEAGWGPGEVEAYVDAIRTPQAARASSPLYRHFLVRELPDSLRGAFRGRRLEVPVRVLHGSRDPLGRELATGIEHHADDGALRDRARRRSLPAGGDPGGRGRPRPGAVRALRLITWNVNRRTSVLAEQAAALAGREPDVVALQEVTRRSWPLWRAALTTIGLPHARRSLDGADPGREPPTRRRTGVVIAAPDARCATRRRSRCRGRRRRSRPQTGGVTVAHAHVPNAANGWIKPDTLAALRAGLEPTTGPRILCGDLNTPRRELADGTVLSFARDSRGRLREERGERWDAASSASSPGCGISGSRMRSARSTAPRRTRPRGSGSTAAAGGSTTSSRRPSSPSPRPSTTTRGATAASATTRRSRPTSKPKGV